MWRPRSASARAAPAARPHREPDDATKAELVQQIALRCRRSSLVLSPLPLAAALSAHLDERDGRYWLRLELRALAAALSARLMITTIGPTRCNPRDGLTSAGEV